MGTWFWDSYGVDWWELDAPRHLFVHTPASIERLAAEAGLRSPRSCGTRPTWRSSPASRSGATSPGASPVPGTSIRPPGWTSRRSSRTASKRPSSMPRAAPVAPGSTCGGSAIPTTTLGTVMSPIRERVRRSARLRGLSPGSGRSCAVPIARRDHHGQARGRRGSRPGAASGHADPLIGRRVPPEPPHPDDRPGGHLRRHPHGARSVRRDRHGGAGPPDRDDDPVAGRRRERGAGLSSGDRDRRLGRPSPARIDRPGDRHEPGHRTARCVRRDVLDDGRARRSTAPLAGDDLRPGAGALGTSSRTTSPASTRCPPSRSSPGRRTRGPTRRSRSSTPACSRRPSTRTASGSTTSSPSSPGSRSHCAWRCRSRPDRAGGRSSSTGGRARRATPSRRSSTVSVPGGQRP